MSSWPDIPLGFREQLNFIFRNRHFAADQTVEPHQRNPLREYSYKLKPTFVSTVITIPSYIWKVLLKNGINSLIYIQRLVAELGVKILLMVCRRVGDRSTGATPRNNVLCSGIEEFLSERIDIHSNMNSLTSFNCFIFLKSTITSNAPLLNGCDSQSSCSSCSDCNNIVCRIDLIGCKHGGSNLRML